MTFSNTQQIKSNCSIVYVFSRLQLTAAGVYITGALSCAKTYRVRKFANELILFE